MYEVETGSNSEDVFHPYKSRPQTGSTQLGEPRSAEREVTGSNPGRTNTQGL